MDWIKEKRGRQYLQVGDYFVVVQRFDQDSYQGYVLGLRGELTRTDFMTKTAAFEWGEMMAQGLTAPDTFPWGLMGMDGKPDWLAS